MAKVLDKDLNIDYSYMLNRTDVPVRIISDEEIMSEESDLIRAFLEANTELTPYIDKALFDPTALVARHIIDLCKDRNYMVEVNGKAYRLPQVIMMIGMAGCYKYVMDVAKALANQTKNKNSIQLADSDVYTIAENYFKHGSIEVKISTEEKKKPTPKKPDAKEEDDLPEEVDTDNIELEPKNKQLSFFDM